MFFEKTIGIFEKTSSFICHFLDFSRYWTAKLDVKTIEKWRHCHSPRRLVLLVPCTLHRIQRCPAQINVFVSIDLLSTATRRPPSISLLQSGSETISTITLAFVPRYDRLAPIGTTNPRQITVVNMEPFHERVQLCSCTGCSTIDELQV